MGCWRSPNFALLKKAAVENPLSRARANTVGTPTTPWSSVSLLFQVIPWSSGPSPVSIEVCEGSVKLGMIVFALSV